MNRFTKLTAVTAVVLATGGSTAMAQQDPADTVYNPNNEVADVVASGTPTPTPPASGTAPDTATSPAPSTDTAPDTSTESTPTSTTSTPSTATRTEQASSGSLPFTGFEAGFVGLAGLALIAGGFAVRRASRSES
jgi:hypothetical protein